MKYEPTANYKHHFPLGKTDGHLARGRGEEGSPCFLGTHFFFTIPLHLGPLTAPRSSLFQDTPLPDWSKEEETRTGEQAL